MSRTLPWPIRGNGRSLVSMVVIAWRSKRGRVARAGMPRDSLFRQRNELMLLRNGRKATGFPVLFGLLDPLLAGGDEIPPDVARAFQRVAAQKHHPRRPQRFYGDAVAG